MKTVQKTPRITFNLPTDSKKVISIDWLDVHFLGKIPEPKEKLELLEVGQKTILQHVGHGTGNYAHLWDCYLEGQLLGQMQTHPRHDFMNCDSVNLKIDNSQLYCKDMIPNLKSLVDDNSLIFKNVTRLDLAIDNVECQDFLNEYISDGKNSPYKRVGKQLLSTVKYNESEKKFETFYIGSRSSDKFLKVYNKSKEIREVSKKNYIKEFWAKNDISDQENIYRLELQMRSKAVKSIKYFSLDKLSSPEYLYSMFRNMAGKYMTFGIIGTDSNLSRMDKINLIDREMPKFTWFLERTEKIETSDVFKAKTMIKLLYRMDYINDTITIHWKNTIKDFIKLFDLEEWFVTKVQDWTLEFEAEKKRKKTLRTVRTA